MSDILETTDSKRKKMGRPPIPYTEQKRDAICDLIANGATMKQIAAMEEMPGLMTIYDWLAKHPDFSDALSHARKIQADTYADQVIEEAFSSHDAQIGRLRTDALKWRAKVLAPKKYGDKIDIETQSQQNFKISFSVPDRSIESGETLTLETPIELQGLPIPAPMPQLRENGEE